MGEEKKGQREGKWNRRRSERRGMGEKLKKGRNWEKKGKREAGEREKRGEGGRKRLLEGLNHSCQNLEGRKGLRRGRG